MAGRFLLGKFSSGTSRSTSLLGAHASASARAAAPVVPRAPQGGIRALSSLVRGAADLPGAVVLSNRGILRYAARFFTVPCSHADAKISCPTNRITSTVINPVKPAFADYVKGGTRTLSSGASNKYLASADASAEEKDWDEHFAYMRRSTHTTVWGCGILYLLWMYLTDNSSRVRESRNKNQGRTHCPGCTCPSGRSES